MKKRMADFFEMEEEELDFVEVLEAAAALVVLLIIIFRPVIGGW